MQIKIELEDNALELMDEIMECIADTKTWRDIQERAPSVQGTRRNLLEMLERAEKIIPAPLLDDLIVAISGYAAELEKLAIMYGVHVAHVIRDVSARPYELSTLLEREG